MGKLYINPCNLLPLSEEKYTSSGLMPPAVVNRLADNGGENDDYGRGNNDADAEQNQGHTAEDKSPLQFFQFFNNSFCQHKAPPLHKTASQNCPDNYSNLPSKGVSSRCAQHLAKCWFAKNWLIFKMDSEYLAVSGEVLQLPRQSVMICGYARDTR